MATQKYSVFSVEDPTWGTLYFSTQVEAMRQGSGTVMELVIDFSKWRTDPASLFAALLNREGFTEYTKEVKR